MRQLQVVNVPNNGALLAVNHLVHNIAVIRVNGEP
jgi:hypothetical protein